MRESLHNSNDDLPSPLRPAVVLLVEDAGFAGRFASVVETVGGRTIDIANAQQLPAAVDRHYPVLAVVDASTPDWREAIRQIKLRAETRQTPIVLLDNGAFLGSDTFLDSGTKWTESAAALPSGVDRIWQFSIIDKELLEGIGHYISPPVRYLEGWDEPMSDSARMGVVEFNRGDYFEQHEYFEEAWNEEPRPIRVLYQGILQVGVAFLQIERGNWVGALKLFRRGLPRLRDLPPICRGIALAEFRLAAEAIHAEVTTLGASGLGEFDRRRFPLIRLVDDEPDDDHLPAI